MRSILVMEKLKCVEFSFRHQILNVYKDWLVEFTKRLRTHLPSGKYILTHARKIFDGYFITH